MKNTIIVLLVVAAASCSPVNVSYDYDRNTNFNAYKTYNFSDDTGDIDTNANPFFKERVMRAVDAEMAERGFTKSENPDLLVDLHVKREDRQDAIASSNYPVGYFPWRFGFASGFNTTQINYNEYVEGTLFINLVDAEKEKIVWQGIATKTLDQDLTPEQREKNVNDAVDRIFEKYPVKPISQ
jgi:hypothetical protein